MFMICLFVLTELTNVTDTHTHTCHTCCMRNCTGSTSQNVSTANWESQCIAVCSTRLRSMLYTSLRHSQSTSFTVSHSTSPDRTTLPAQHFQSLGLLCRWSDNLELATGQSRRPGAHQQQLQTIAEDEPISSLPLSTHSTVEMLHDSVLYKSIIDIDIDIDINGPFVHLK